MGFDSNGRLVTHQKPGEHIDKNIGRIFKTHNIFEFKSETDSLAIQDYNKVVAYALLYSSFTSASVVDITVSFAVTIHPRELLKYLDRLMQANREIFMEVMTMSSTVMELFLKWQRRTDGLKTGLLPVIKAVNLKERKED